LQTLTVKQAIKAAGKAYDAKLLTAQHPVKEKRKCVYELGKYHCAIGAGMNASTIKDVKAMGLNSGWGGLGRVEKYGCMKTDDIIRLSALQAAHDAWANESRDGGANAKETRLSKARFLKLIGRKEAA
jgi:hypothetical protein